MKFYQICNIYITYTITVSKHKMFIIFWYILCTSQYSFRYKGFKARINKSYFEFINLSSILHMKFCFVICSFKRKICSKSFLIEEVIFDIFCFVSQRKDKLIKSVVGINFHDMPEKRLVTNIYHWFWLKFSLLFHASSHA